jgi:hypothetical protein
VRGACAERHFLLFSKSSRKSRVPKREADVRRRSAGELPVFNPPLLLPGSKQSALMWRAPRVPGEAQRLSRLICAKRKTTTEG